MVWTEDDEHYGKLQQVFAAVHRLTGERRLTIVTAGTKLGHRFAAVVVAVVIGALASASFAAAPRGKADKVFVEKSTRRLTLLRGGKPLRVYRIALGTEPVGPKEQEGDRRTPEGLYVVDYRIAKSNFHRALHISYPNAADRARAAALGVSPGGDVMIHGIKNGFGWLGKRHRATDWTHGCIAVADDEIEEIWKLVPDGTVVEIVP